MTTQAKILSEALWKTMRDRDMCMEDALDVCAMVIAGVGRYAPASHEELADRILDKLERMKPEKTSALRNPPGVIE